MAFSSDEELMMAMSYVKDDIFRIYIKGKGCHMALSSEDRAVVKCCLWPEEGSSCACQGTGLVLGVGETTVILGSTEAPRTDRVPSLWLLATHAPCPQ